MSKALLYSMCILTITAGYVCIRRKRLRKRRFGVRPLNRSRFEKGHFENLVKDMIFEEHDTSQFIKYTRMTPNLFYYLLELVRPYLEKTKQNAISPGQRLMMTLHFLSQGCSMQEIAWNYRIGHSTAHYILLETCDVLWNILQPIVLKSPTMEDFENIKEGFFKRWNMPNCLGAVDGKHINIICPKLSGSQYFNYKKSFSIVLMAACDAYYKFTLVDIGMMGSHHDNAVFTASSFGDAVVNGKMDIPPKTALPNSDIEMEHFFVADQAFPLHKNIMRPYPGSYLGEEKNIFNYRLSRARRVIENTFGILSQRWRILLKPIIANVDNCERITKATIVLHNFLQKNEEDIPEGERHYCPTGLIDSANVNENGPGSGRNINSLKSVLKLGSNNSTRRAQEARDNLCSYFVSDAGCVTWQWDHILRGSLPS